MHFKLVYSSAISPMQRPENTGFELSEIRSLLGRLEEQGHTVEYVDTSGMDDNDRYRIYSGEAVLAAGNKYRVRRVFGSNNHPGEHFGSYVPGLIISATGGERPADVFPHESRDGKTTTIVNYLNNALHP